MDEGFVSDDKYSFNGLTVQRRQILANNRMYVCYEYYDGSLLVFNGCIRYYIRRYEENGYVRVTKTGTSKDYSIFKFPKGSVNQFIELNCLYLNAAKDYKLAY